MAGERRFDVACLGRAAVDLYGEQLGCRLEDISTFAKYLGGSPANTAVGASRLGLKAAMITRVGDEHNGRFVREALAREGVDVGNVSTDEKRLTALVFLAIRDADTFPHIFYRHDCADMGLRAEHIDGAVIAASGALLLSGTHFSQDGTFAACERAVEMARAAGCKIILDIDYRPVLWGLAAPGEGESRYVASTEVTHRMASLLPACDLIVGTEEEIRIAGGAHNTLAALCRLREKSAALIVLKRGADGCVAFPGEIPGRIEDGVAAEGFPVEVFNVLGAGDAFMAGLLRGWLRAHPLEESLRFANACGALVVSRHGCAPAIPSWVELQSFLSLGVTTPKLRFDRELEHVHRATTRRPLATPLHILAFDHRSQLETVADACGAPHGRIAAFKALVAAAFIEANESRNVPAGVLLDDRYGEATLPKLTGRGWWVARPVEAPGSVPLEFEAGANVGLQLRTWPSEHIVKCLAFFHADDPAPLRDAQVENLAALAAACAQTNHELLLEIIPPQRPGNDARTVARAIEALYASGIRPDWWKLPPATDTAAWHAIDAVIDKHDPHCRGVLVLGMEAGDDQLRESFAAAMRSRWVRGFAVGRSIFADAAQEWFSGRMADSAVVEAVKNRYLDIGALWEEARRESTFPTLLEAVK